MTPPSYPSTRLLRNRALACLGFLSVALLFSGCSTIEPSLPLEPHPGYSLVDPSKVDASKYTADYKACAQLANQGFMDPTRAAVGAIGGVADKASLGIFGSGKSREADRTTVLKRCLTGRGYTVLR